MPSKFIVYKPCKRQLEYNKLEFITEQASHSRSAWDSWKKSSVLVSFKDQKRNSWLVPGDGSCYGTFRVGGYCHHGSAWPTLHHWQDAQGRLKELINTIVLCSFHFTSVLLIYWDSSPCDWSKVADGQPTDQIQPPKDFVWLLVALKLFTKVQ